MLLTAIEIIAFLVAAAILGVALGWVLRGSLGSEQVEINDLRAQLRQLKKANRESRMALEESDRTETETGEAEASKAAETPAKKAPAKSKAPAKAGKKASVRKTQAEREADQAAGRKAFAEVVERVGKSDEQDKLTKIYGVGKKYADMLNALDISTYAQISKLRKADVRTLAAALGVLDDRLETEDWVGSAKELLKQANK